MLTNDIGRRPHLIIIQLVILGYQVGMQVLGTVVGIQPNHEGFRWTDLVDSRHHVIPQCDNTLLREVITGLIEQYKGRVVDTPGDNILSEFGSVVNAVKCAVEIQKDLAEHKISSNNTKDIQNSYRHFNVTC